MQREDWDTTPPPIGLDVVDKDGVHWVVDMVWARTMVYEGDNIFLCTDPGRVAFYVRYDRILRKWVYFNHTAAWKRMQYATMYGNSQYSTPLDSRAIRQPRDVQRDVKRGEQAAYRMGYAPAIGTRVLMSDGSYVQVARVNTRVDVTRDGERVYDDYMLWDCETAYGQRFYAYWDNPSLEWKMFVLEIKLPRTAAAKLKVTPPPRPERLRESFLCIIGFEDDYVYEIVADSPEKAAQRALDRAGYGPVYVYKRMTARHSDLVEWEFVYNTQDRGDREVE